MISLSAVREHGYFTFNETNTELKYSPIKTHHTVGFLFAKY